MLVQTYYNSSAGRDGRAARGTERKETKEWNKSEVRGQECVTNLRNLRDRATMGFG